MKALPPGFALCLAMIASGARAAPPEPPRVRLDSGELEGVSLGTADGPLLAFKGVPYAASPAGAGRWRPPSPAASWEGIRSARELGPVCPQPDREAANFRRLTTALGGDPSWVPPLGATSEDCLSLNVFTGRLGSAEARPVMVWLHGGANRFGSGKEQASVMVRHGVVVVTLNYRLGLLGFLAHPALRQESPQASSGNYALLDQIEALRWVRRNIAAFGGDPERVTIFGHSAGGGSVAQLLASPLARGLFHRAVIQSGGLSTSRPSAEMEAEGLKVADQLGVPRDNPLPALRAVPVERLLAAGNGPFDTAADGWVIPDPGPGALAAGPGATVPLLVGATADEARVFALPRDLKSFQAAVEETGPAWKERVSARYPAANDEQAGPALSRLMTDRDFLCPARYVAARRSGPTWLYLFSAAPTPGPGSAGLGAFHGSDVRLLFDLTYGVPQRASEEKLGDAMRRYWARFAATGDPNAEGLPPWPRRQASPPRHLELNEPIEARPGLGGANCDLFDAVWDAAYPPRPPR
jgi:para-nitrobenzyl esterase